VAHSTWELEIGRSWFKASLGKKLVRPYLSKNKPMWWFTPVIPATQEMEVGRSWSKASLYKKHKTLSEK
jgi:hypothetical protein